MVGRIPSAIVQNVILNIYWHHFELNKETCGYMFKKAGNYKEETMWHILFI